MKPHPLLRRITLFLSLAAGVAAARGQVSEVTEDAGGRVPAEVFPIFPWDILRATEASYAEARECGFNVAGFVHPENLDAVAKAGLKCFVSDPSIKVRGGEDLSDEEITKRVSELTAKTAKHPAVLGYHVVDEPANALVPTVVRWTKALQAADPDAIAYTNFFPIAENADGKGKIEDQYERYLSSFLEPAKPRAFSFDHYSFMDDGSVRPTYFDCLEVARKVALKTGVPFWHVGLANTHFHYAEPSPAIFRYQIFTSLAYGARGMGWFTYTGRDRGNYRAAAIDLAGRRTPTWEMLRDANLQLHRLAPICVKLKSVNVFHHPDVPLGCKGLASSKFLSDVKGTGPFCIGEFEDENGKPAVLIVNRDLRRSTQVTITPKNKSAIQRVSSLTGKTRAWGAEDNWLPPGGGILLLLKG